MDQAKRSAEAAEQQVQAAQRQVEIMLDQLAEQRAERSDRISAEQRQALIDVLTTGDRWIGTLMPVIETRVGQDGVPLADASEALANYKLALEAYGAAVTHARLTLPDDDLRMIVEPLGIWPSLWPDVLTRSPGSRLADRNPVTDAAIREAFDALKSNRDALDNVRKIAERIFTTSTPADDAGAPSEGNVDTTATDVAADQ